VAFLLVMSDSEHQLKPLWDLDEVPMWVISCATTSAGNCYLDKLQVRGFSELNSALPSQTETRARSWHSQVKIFKHFYLQFLCFS